MEYSSSALPRVQHGLAASTEQLCLEIFSLATVPGSWRSSSSSTVCSSHMELFLLPAHPSYSPTPLLPGLSPVQILDVSMALCNDLFLFINYSVIFCRTQTSWDTLLGDRHQQSRDSEKEKLKDAVITVLHKSIQYLSPCLLHIQNVQVSKHCAA